MGEIKNNKEFTLIRESEPPKNIYEMLIEGETILVCFKTAKAFVLFTNKRIVLRSTGKKRETRTIPYSSIDMYSTEIAKGLRDLGLLQIWTKTGLFKFNLKKAVNVHDLDSIIATQLL